MIQSMEILQLPIMALQERIEQELSENPVLVDLRESPSTSEADGEGEDATPAAVAAYAHEWIHLGGVERAMAALRRHGCREVVVVGHVLRPNWRRTRMAPSFSQGSTSSS